MSNDLDNFNDNSKYCVYSKNGIKAIENKNRIELINNCDRLTGSIYQSLSRVNNSFHSECHSVTWVNYQRNYESSTKANFNNDVNKRNKNFNGNFLNRVNCVEKIGGNSFIRFNNLNDLKDYENGFTAKGIDPYRPNRNTNLIQNPNNPNNNFGNNHNQNNVSTGKHNLGTGGNHHY